MPTLITSNGFHRVMTLIAQDIAVVINVRDRRSGKFEFAEHRCERILLIERNVLTGKY